MTQVFKPYIFVHIQKTGGTSIEKAIGGNPEHGAKHRTALELRDFRSREEWNSAFKFSFVRNPWDRLVSWWTMIDAAREAPPNAFFRYIQGQAKTFAEFLSDCDRDIADHDGRKWIYRNQIDYLRDESGEVIVDFIGRYERLETDFAAVANRILGKAAPLSWENRSRHRPYAEYFTREMADSVGLRYERDIAAFGYRFGE